jgi:phosphoribosylformylglycinamidine synthase PurS subunit
MLRAEVYVTLKPVVNDPAGLTIRSGLHSLGFDSVAEVRAGKYLVLTLDEEDEATARSRVEEMARQLLANEVIEDYRVVMLDSSASPLRGGHDSSPSPLRGGQGRGS